MEYKNIFTPLFVILNKLFSLYILENMVRVCRR